MTRPLAWLGLVLGIAAAAACSSESPGTSDANAEDVDSCTECKNILAECTSTSVNEEQFILCRDQWQACQQGRGVERGQCSNPRDAEACDLCRTRLQECKGAADADAELCTTQFSVCKAFLISRGDVQHQCQEEATPVAAVGCDVCEGDYFACVSDASEANASQICSDKRTTCLTANEVDEASCALPVPGEACGLCQTQHQACVAGGGEGCDEGFAQCAQLTAPEVACELSTGEGGGGQGGGGQGGGGQGGGGPDICDNDVCVE
ncbi:MAG: hypothetical protein KC731_30070, partial [Myxococcales bacterium]|nr:hypothetical protein [Myxococcales bacterium]